MIQDDFSIFFERSFPSQSFKLLSWSPSKDLLLAVSSNGSTANCYRIETSQTWTLVWFVTAASSSSANAAAAAPSISSVVWNSSGNCVALGLANGSLQLHELETGDLILKEEAKTPSCSSTKRNAILHLAWNCSSTTHANHNFTATSSVKLVGEAFRDKLPRLSALAGSSTDSTAASMDSASLDTKFSSLFNSSDASAPLMDLLLSVCCTDDDDDNNNNNRLSVINFSLYGIFRIGSIKIPNYRTTGEGSPPSCLPPVVLKTAISPSFNTLSIITAQESSSSSSSRSSTTTTRFQLHRLNLTALLKRNKSLCTLAMRSVDINNVIKYLNTVVQLLCKEYKLWQSANSKFFSDIKSKWIEMDGEFHVMHG